MHFLLLAAALIAAQGKPSDSTQGKPFYKVEIDNAWVHVVREVVPPHEKTEPHKHLESVTVWMTDSRQHKAGDVSHALEGLHVEDNSSDHAVEEIVIELKTNAPPSKAIALDPVALDPKYHSVAFENARVRALRTTLEPGIKSPLHEHPHYVVVYLTDLHTTMTLGDGREVDNPRHPGETAWRDYMKHSTLNIGTQTAVEIQVELK